MLAVESVVHGNQICDRVHGKDSVKASIDAMKCRKRLIAFCRPSQELNFPNSRDRSYSLAFDSTLKLKNWAVF